MLVLVSCTFLGIVIKLNNRYGRGSKRICEKETNMINFNEKKVLSVIWMVLFIMEIRFFRE